VRYGGFTSFKIIIAAEKSFGGHGLA
jgi:hypothetical protein